MTPTPITDASIDALIEQAKPVLRSSIRAACEQLIPIHLVEIGKIPLPSGQQWQLVLAIMTEPMSNLVSAVALQGYPGIFSAFEKAQKSAEPAKVSGGFSIPG